ncbi:MAG: EamA family transporter [Candidatus Kerfeldbacteria bacterium]|nr:EamA family transporter [Candidatus Kerfeldbacteria bacterium]
MKLEKMSLVYAMTSAVLFGVSIPLAKLLIEDISPVALAGLLYLGAFVGLSLYSFMSKKNEIGIYEKDAKLTRTDLPWLIGAIVTGGIIGPISMMIGLTFISGLSASLLLNLEGLATAVIAVFFFKENAGKRFWLALVCMTMAGVFLTWQPNQNNFSLTGPLLIILAMICWGIDNNLTRIISDKNPIQISKIKGLVAGVTSLLLALSLGANLMLGIKIIFALLLGAFSYGISLVFFIKALKGLGSSRTGMFFSLAPFIGAIVSIIILKEPIQWTLLPTICLMIIGIWLINNERHEHEHLHLSITHVHSHNHSDMHHTHEHSELTQGQHAHEHTHPEISHTHIHWPDTQHRHKHI